MSVAGAMSVPVPCGAIHGGATGATSRTGPVPTSVGYDVRVIIAKVVKCFLTGIRSSPLHDVPSGVTGLHAEVMPLHLKLSCLTHEWMPMSCRTL